MQVTVKINEIEVTINRPELSDLEYLLAMEIPGKLEEQTKDMLKFASDKAFELLKQTSPCKV